MIIDDLLHFFQHGLSTRRLVLMYIKRYILSVFIFIGLYFKLCIYAKENNLQYSILGFFPGTIIVFVLGGLFISYQSVRVLRNKYKFKVKQRGFSFYSRDWELFHLIVLKVYLDRKNINTKEAIEKLKEDLKEQSEFKIKNQVPFYVGSFILLFIPVWSATNNSVFKSVSTLKEAYIYLGIIALFIVFINFAVVSLKRIIKIAFFNDLVKTEELNYFLTALAYEYYLYENNLKKNNPYLPNNSRVTIKFKLVKEVLEDYYKRYPERI
ncbi:hypothetical protein [Priestia megaterium]|uniref:hypothetical protein n=1 Tax=Priestia megaterium TaxID=1404 RepID=UPI002B248D95|nr:hypothetical protein [Priestia megaterium]MEB2294461.1 hypothetical protein [Priestia megaterium]